MKEGLKSLRMNVERERDVRRMDKDVKRGKK